MDAREILVAVVLPLVGAFIGWVVKSLVGRGVYGRMDSLEARLRVQEQRYSDIEKKLATGHLSFEYLRGEVKDLRVDFNELSRFRRNNPNG